MSIDTNQDQQEFDAAFAELAKPKSDSPAQPTEAQPSPTESAPEAQPVVAEPTPEAQSAPASEEQPAKPAADLDRQLAEALHRERSSANRLSHFMRENNRLTSELAKATSELAKLRTSAPEPSRAPAGTRDVLAEAPDLEAAVQERLKSATADLRAQLEEQAKVIQELKGKTDTAARAVEPLVAKQHQDEISQTHAELDKTFGDAWRKDIASSKFAQWINEQPGEIQKLYHRGTSFKDASRVMTYFYADTGTQRPTPAPASDPAPTPTPAGKPAASEQRLRAAAGIKPGTVVKPSSRNDDFDGSFAEFAAMRQQQRNQAGFR